MGHFVNWQLKDFQALYSAYEQDFLCLETAAHKVLLPQVIIIDNTGHKPLVDQMVLNYEEAAFTLDSELKSLSELPFKALFSKLQQNRRLFNGDNLRLLDYELLNGCLKLRVQTAKYFDYIHTNLIIDAELENGLTMRRFIHPKGKMPSLSQSKLANNFGINALILTSDQRMVFQKRSDSVAFWQNLFSPSGSGALKKEDLPMFQGHLLSEILEEINIATEELFDIRLLGITRELIRGGQPEMFFFAKTHLSSDQIKTRWLSAMDQWESEKIFFYPFKGLEKGQLVNLQAFERDVEDFISKYFDASTMPLKTNFSLFAKMMINNGGYDNV